MKRFIIAAISTILILSGCGVGVYSTSSGHDEKAAISFTTQGENMIVTVTVDGQPFNLKCVNQKAYKAKRNIRMTAENTLTTTPGRHEVKVTAGDREVYSQVLILNNSEHRFIDL